MIEISLLELFHREGTGFIIEGNRIQILEDPSYAWMVEGEKASIFLAHLTEDGRTGRRYFLFEVKAGDIIFGIKPAGVERKICLVATGTMRTGLIRLRIEALAEHLTGQQAVALQQQWVRAFSSAIASEESLSEIAATKELQMPNEEFLTSKASREALNHELLLAALAIWEKSALEEGIRLREKTALDKSMLASSLYRLSSISSDDKEVEAEGLINDNLLEACRLVGGAMGLQIISPAVYSSSQQTQSSLQEVARASRIRTREVVLHREWYRQDCGPILGFMSEDDRPVALIPASPNKYTMYDPMQREKKMVDRDVAEGLRRFGFILFRPLENKGITLKDLLTFGLQSSWKRDIIMVAVMGILGGLLATLIPLATGIVFSSIIPEGERGLLLQIAFFLAASVFAALLFQMTRSLALLRLEGKMEASIQPALWDRLLSLPVPFFRQFSAGELAMRAMGISQIRIILSGATLNSILSSIFSVFTFCILFFYDTKLAWIACLLVMLSVGITSLLGYWQLRYARRVLEISNKISGMMLQLIGGVTKFRVAGAEGRAFYQWAKEFGTQRQLTFKRETIGNWQTTFSAIFPLVATMVIYYSYTKGADSMAPGEFIAFNAAFITFMLSMTSLSTSIIDVNVVIPLYQRSKPILDALPEYDENKVSPMPLTGSIEVSHVTFRYHKDGPLILDDISFKVSEGDYIALVGTSGCGKSTLFRVLLGFEEPEKGKIYYNGQDLSKVDIRSVRRQLGVVLQNGQLMTGTIFNNIAGTNPFLTLENAWEAAAMAGIDEDIRDMPMGMHTVIGEGSGTISGGQKQRIMIARAIVNKPKIIFFDEATSALDNNTQAIVSGSLDQLQATRIVIAHRLSTIRNCNKIIVMDRGKLVEMGSFDELMKIDGVFAALAKRQLL